MKKIFGFTIIWTVWACTGLAAGAKARVTIEDLLALKIPNSPVLSPDGKRVAFVLTEPDFPESKYRSHIEVVNTETGASRRFTNGLENETAPRWSPDGQWLAFLSQRKTKADKKEKDEDDEEGPGDSGKSQVWILPADGGEAQKLSNAPEGVMSYEWMPDGRAVVYLAKEPHPKAVKESKSKDKKSKIDGVVEDEEKFRKQLWIVPLDSKKEKRISAGDLGIAEFAISPDGTKIAYATNYTGKEDDEKKFDLWAVRIADGKPWRVTARPGGERSPRWSPDSRSIIFIATVDPEVVYSQNDLFIVAVDGGEPRNLTKDFDQAVGNPIWPVGSPAIYFTADARTDHHLYRLNPDTLRVEPLTQGAKVVNGFDVSRDGRTWVWSMEDATSAPDLWYRSAEVAAAARPLTRLNPQVEGFDLGAQEILRWKGVDGWDIEGVLVKPVGYQPGRKYPTLIAIHGGPYGRTLNTLRQYNQFQVWAANGYAVLAPNYRGSAGYGNRFGVANRGDIGGKDYQDIMAGVDAVIRMGLADPERLGVFGGSYGGYMTNWIITQTPRFKAAISMFGIFNLITDFSNSTLPSWEPDYMTKYYWDHLDAYLKRSPFYYVKNIQTPVLILHGQADTNTFISNSKELYQALRTLNKPVEFVHYPREGHGLREPNHRIDEMRRGLQWFDRYLKGISPENGAEFGLKQPVRRGGWELTVLSATPVSDYLGRTADEEETFVEVLLTLQSRSDAPEALTVHLSHGDTADLRLTDRAGRVYYPAGVPTEALGERILVSGTEPAIAVTPDKENKSAVVPLRVAFAVPKGTREFLVKVKDFPPVHITVQALKDE